MNWNEQHCLLTGATGGIGRAMAHALAERGVTLTLQGRSEASLQALSEALPGHHTIIAADLSTSEGRQHVIEQVLAQGELSMLINNAGISHLSLLEDTSEALLEQIMQTNLMAPLSLTRGLLPLLSQRPEGHIINVGSAFGSIGFAGQTSYCASKFGLRGFSEALHRELADRAINVFYLAPRATATSINSDAAMAMNQQLGNAVDDPSVVAEALIQQLEKQTPRYHIGFPERFFAKLNGLIPGWVDNALKAKLTTVKHHSSPSYHKEKNL